MSKVAPQTRKMMRFTKTLSMGIVGMPNVGKSLLFNILSRKDLAKTANFPFCTIKPSEARVEVPDERFTWLCENFKPKNEVPATLKIIDIAGLVKGAANNEGLGNEFLSNIRSVQGIYQVVRIFENEEVTHVEGSVDPVRDLDIINEELRLKDLEWMTNIQADLEKKMKSDPSKFKDQYEMCKKVKDYIENNKKPIRAAPWTAVEDEYIESLQLLTAKPTIFLLNLDKQSYLSKRNKHLPAVVKWIKEMTGELAVPFSASYEEELMNDPSIDPTGKTSAIPKIVRNGFKDLGLICFFTCGHDEVRGWVVQNGATAPIAGSVIHNDFRDYFIKAEVYHFDDIKELGSEANVKAAGKLRSEGKNYVVQDGDIILYRHGSAHGKKK